MYLNMRVYRHVFCHVLYSPVASWYMWSDMTAAWGVQVSKSSEEFCCSFECILSASLSARWASRLGLISTLRPSTMWMCVHTHKSSYIPIQLDTYKQNIHVCIACIMYTSCMHCMYACRFIQIHTDTYNTYSYIHMHFFWGGVCTRYHCAYVVCMFG